jgi:hypothetical protein
MDQICNRLIYQSASSLSLSVCVKDQIRNIEAGNDCDAQVAFVCCLNSNRPDPQSGIGSSDDVMIGGVSSFMGATIHCGAWRIEIGGRRACETMWLCSPAAIELLSL